MFLWSMVHLLRHVRSPSWRTKAHLTVRCYRHETKLTFYSKPVLRRFNYSCRQITSLPLAETGSSPAARLACTNYRRSVSQMRCSSHAARITKLSSSFAGAVQLQALVAPAGADDVDGDKNTTKS